MSLPRFPSRRHKGRHVSPESYGMENDVYVVYNEDDLVDVLPVLQCFTDNGLRVFDPRVDGAPNESLMKTWVDRGVYNAKKTVLFITKKFLQSQECTFQASLAVIRYIHTQGLHKHRVLLLLLESACTVPKYLQAFKCVYAWKYKTNPVKQLYRIYTEVNSDPKPRFRRGKFTIPTPFAGFCQSREDREQKKLKYHQLLLNFHRLKFVLDSCELQCKSEGCNFHCSGLDFNNFYFHVKTCKHQLVKCRYCDKAVLFRNRSRHEEERCPKRRIQCPHEFCKRLFPQKSIEAHKRICPFQEVACPNNQYGCSHVFAKKDQLKHMEICDFAMISCVSCNNPYFRIDFYTHSCPDALPNYMRGSRQSSVEDRSETFRCKNSGCNFSGAYDVLRGHDRVCEFKMLQCPDCGGRMPRSQLMWHQKECDTMVECGTCHMTVPRSSMLTHEKFVCRGKDMVALCSICHTLCHREEHCATCDYNTSAQPTVANGSGIAGATTPYSRATQSHGVTGSPTAASGDSHIPGGSLIQTQSSVESDGSQDSLTAEQVLVSAVDTVVDVDRNSATYINPRKLPRGKMTPSLRRRFNELLRTVEINPSMFRGLAGVDERPDFDSLSFCQQSEHYSLNRD